MTKLSVILTNDKYLLLRSITHEIFQTDDSNNFNLRKNRGFKPGNPKKVYYGTETISVLRPKLWIILPGEILFWKNFKVRLRIGCI